MKQETPSHGTPPLITDESQLSAALNELASGHGPFAVDTERASGIRYSSRAYLIQIKRTDGGLHLIDPIALHEQMPRLGEVLREDEWILHAADQDLPCLRMEGFEPPAVFDTEMAALLLGDEKVSLQAVIHEELGIELAKEHSNSDWSMRPLPPELLTYAALDVDLLIEVRASLMERLEDKGRLEWMNQENDYILRAPAKEPPVDPWRRVAASAGLREPRMLAVLRDMWNTRERIARERDLAPGKVVANKALGAFIVSQPASLADAQKHSAFKGRRQEFAKPMYKAYLKGFESRDLPPRKRPTEGIPDVRQWAKQNERAAQRWDVLRPRILERADQIGIRQDILLKPAIQRQAAWQGWSNLTEATHVLIEAGARPWQVEELASALPRDLS